MRALLGVLIGCVALAGEPGAAAAQEDDPARDAFDEGVAHFEADEHEAALEAFNRANELHPSWKLLYNIGQCEAALRQFGLALTHFERYLSEGGDEVSPERRDEVLAEVERLRKMVGSIDLEAPAGAVILIDGVERGTAPLTGRLRVSASVEHVIEVRSENEQLLERTVTVGGGETIEIRVDAAGEATAAAGDAPTSDPPAADEPGGETSGLKIGGWITLGLGAAIAAGGGVTGGLALKTNSELGERCTDNVCEPADQDEIDKRDALAMTSNVLLGVGAAAVVAGVLMLVLGGDGETEAEVALRPVLAPELTGVAAEWRF
jgi:hypothetical protein